MAGTGGADDSPATFQKLSQLAFGTVMAAAARDYKKELEATQRQASQSGGPKEDEVDLDELDKDDPELDRIQAKRLEALKREEAARHAAKEHQGWQGEYREIVEVDFLPEVTGTQHVACHFFHKDFPRCKILDMHLKALSAKYTGTKFIKIDAVKCPFFVTKLKVKVLPCLILFRDGVAFDRIVGFQELGHADDFPTNVLEARLLRAGVISAKCKSGGKGDNDSEEEDNGVEAGYGGGTSVRFGSSNRDREADSDSD
ncbi:hypothetical protein CBR_g943 [Chara braunii]|uniref:Thioredoxin domain-containing protein n=1 Tax=Chara braunii TaxID=69332 RepID=A0A388KCM8_CHABU|nr:hypothetical protein CBR_g943 [Chara braunii]|eukprot:GBG67822.1 hypothetical protein CBR_g943 [Chara braunii]